ncbi:MAG: SCO family protein [Halobacteriales archaeon]|nr:SCO family protein [Halobacteriales archaeon]
MIDRRTFVGTAAVGGALLGSGCISALGGNENVVLSPPENYDLLRDAELPYPIYGESLPEATVEAPLRDSEVSVPTDFEGDRHVLLTFIFTRCTGVCPGLTANLVRAQADAAERGYSDEVALTAITFDPVHDDEDVLRQYADDRGVDRDADNFYLLRPDGEERGKEVVEETYGHGYQKTELYSPEGELEHGGNETDSDAPSQPFDHMPLFFLVNKDGYVERSYANTAPKSSTVVEDLRALQEGY